MHDLTEDRCVPRVLREQQPGVDSAVRMRDPVERDRWHRKKILLRHDQVVNDGGQPAQCEHHHEHDEHLDYVALLLSVLFPGALVKHAGELVEPELVAYDAVQKCCGRHWWQVHHNGHVGVKEALALFLRLANVREIGRALLVFIIGYDQDWGGDEQRYNPDERHEVPRSHEARPPAVSEVHREHDGVELAPGDHQVGDGRRRQNGEGTEQEKTAENPTGRLTQAPHTFVIKYRQRDRHHEQGH